jgi:opine dehydrogenase
MKVAVLGSGNGALGVAFDWAQHGHTVSMANAKEFTHHIDPIGRAEGITATGDLHGFAKIAYAGNDAGRAMEGAELVFVVGAAFATETIARTAAPYLTPGQAIVVCPTSCAGSAAFKAAAGIDTTNTDYTVGETSTLPYAVRTTGPGEIHFFKKIDGGFYVAGLPRSGTDRLYDILREVYPTVEKAGSIFQTTLQNGNPVIHPAVTLLNAARIEQTAGDFDFYWAGVTPAVGDLMEAVDNERLAIGNALGIHVIPEPTLGVMQGYNSADNYNTGYSTAPGFKGIKAQDKLDNRYLTEDVGYTMIFLTELAERVGVPTPVMNGIIDISGVLLHRDFRREAARTLAGTHLDRFTVAQLTAL